MTFEVDPTHVLVDVEAALRTLNSTVEAAPRILMLSDFADVPWMTVSVAVAGPVAGAVYVTVKVSVPASAWPAHTPPSAVPQTVMLAVVSPMTFAATQGAAVNTRPLQVVMVTVPTVDRTWTFVPVSESIVSTDVPDRLMVVELAERPRTVASAVPPSKVAPGIDTRRSAAAATASAAPPMISF